MKPDYELVQKYDQAAKDLISMNWFGTKNKELLHEMIVAFIKEVCKK